jgi:hypothetical protein
MLGWTAFSLAGMLAFGRESWQRHADMLAIYFDILGRFAPIAVHPDGRRLVVRPWGRGLVESGGKPPPIPAFVIVMLATVLFDGLLGTSGWRILDRSLASSFPQWNDRDGVLLGSAGLAVTCLAFLAAYAVTCRASARLGGASAAAVALAFAATLVPIAVAYNVAHNLGYLIEQGRGVIALASDPLGRGWDLFGTAAHTPDIGLVDARLAWRIAIGAVVGGHVIAVWLAHRVALATFAGPRRAIAASIPLTALMVAYTAISLWVIADPLVRFRTPDPGYTSAPSGSMG